MLKTKAGIINWLSQKYGYKRYLEISAAGTGHHFNDVHVETKDCLNYAVPTYQGLTNIDHNIPCLEYDQHLDRLTGQKFDIILVDPYHTVNQSLKDINTALKFLSDDGIIVVHDCNPPDKNHIGTSKGSSWCGQTYEAFILFRANHPDMDTFVIDTDYGCGIIRPNKDGNNIIVDVNKLKDWRYFYANRHRLLDLINVNDVTLRLSKGARTHARAQKPIQPRSTPRFRTR